MVRIFALALRNLSRQTKRNVLLGAAIAIGVMVITIINSSTGGFIKSAGDNFSHLLAGHLFIEGKEMLESGRVVPRLGNYEEIIPILSEGAVPAASIHLRSSFMGKLIFEGATLSLRVEGIRWDEEHDLMNRLSIREGSWDNVLNPSALVLSSDTAEALDAAVGDLVLVQLETITGQQNVGEFVVSAIPFDPGLLSTVSAYADIDSVNELLNMPPGEYMKLSVKLKDVRSMDRHDDTLSELFKERGMQLFPRLSPSAGLGLFDVSGEDTTWIGIKYQISTLSDLLSQLSQAIRILDVMGWGILSVLLFIIMTGITNTYRMVIYERTKEIGTMRALGMQRAGILQLFLWEAGLLGFAGAVVGTAAAFLVMGGVSIIQWGLDTPLFLFLTDGKMKFALSGWQIAANAGAVVVLCVVSAVAPARRAAAFRPGEAISKTY